ncbi:MFS general substrate transporter [Punctularia strigosozonata HHB-11173 SS5]|uniref:MFS general substrate transporter n=1 Tax=Punctularia strigosozonata (strain HHB-11173) TaxID=741275 RepID=UPI000441646F|nr:MFS general substrate transporter [Punctularia strigosozonata HHB-11173 SS5]EIN07711.1 MFS general substrate transporter [Punctularia strigosozonata HHB-11173 SS5]
MATKELVTLPEVQGTGGPDAQLTTPPSDEAPKQETGTHGLTDQTNFLPARQVIAVFMGLSVALMCSFLDQTIVATALPKISSDLHSGKISSWASSFPPSTTHLAFTPLYGRWSDVFGRKIVLMVSLAIFFVFSLACALSQTMIQACASSGTDDAETQAIITMVLIIVSDIVSLKDRGKYQGINEAIIAISNGVGPILGGVFSQDTTWRWAFWINLPLGGLAIAVSLWLLPLKKVHGDMKSKLLRIDYAGSLLTIISSVLLLVNHHRGGVTFPWASAAVLVPIILGVLVFGVFLYWEANHASLPIVPVRIFKTRTVVGVYICTLANGMTFFAILYYVPQFLQVVRGSSPITSGLLVLPFLAPPYVSSFVVRQITSRTGRYRPMIIIGYALWSVAQGLQSTITQDSSDGKIVGYLLLGGIASGGTFQTSLIAAQAAVPRSEMAVVTGVRNYVRLFGSTLGLAICASIVNNELKGAIRPLGLSSQQISQITNDPTIIHDSSFNLTNEQRRTVIDGYAKGFKNVFYLTMACVLMAFISSVLLIQHHSLKRADDKELKEATKRELLAKKMKKKGLQPGDQDLESQTPEPEQKAQ